MGSLNSNLNIKNNLQESNNSSARITNNILDRNNVLSHPQNIAIKPNIHIHNKHAPSSTSSLSHLTYADTPPPHAPPPQQPHVSENHSSLTHAQTGIHNTNHNVSTNTNTNTNIDTNLNIDNNLEESNTSSYPSSAQITNKLHPQKHPEIKETDEIYMDYNNLVENNYTNQTADNNLDFNIDNTSSYTPSAQIT